MNVSQGGSPPTTQAEDREEPHHRLLQRDNDHRGLTNCLYLSHFVSTWNSRLFELGVFLYLAHIFPQTLLPASVYALSGSAAAAILSPWVGNLIDSVDRLRLVRRSIIFQRLAVATSCSVLSVPIWTPSLLRNRGVSALIITTVSSSAAVEKVAAMMATISVERDWVPILAAQDANRLQVLNARMRRIDLFCKLVGPLAISLIDSISTKAAIIATGSMTALSLPAEYFAIAHVYKSTPALRAPKLSSSSTPCYLWSTGAPFKSVVSYIEHPVFFPSFSLALLYATVLSFSGPMVTYLLNNGTDPSALGAIRAVSTVFELMATWLAPYLMSRIGPTRSGAWFINWQSLFVSTACILLWSHLPRALANLGLILAVGASRVGLWGFDLCAQILIQEEVDDSSRGTFSSQEAALQNIFEMLAFASTTVFSRPEQFKIPALLSALAVCSAAVLYVVFVRTRRGHLVHWAKIVDWRKPFRMNGWQSLDFTESLLLDTDNRQAQP